MNESFHVLTRSIECACPPLSSLEPLERLERLERLELHTLRMFHTDGEHPLQVVP
jgi:hypothetical protein